MTKLVRYAGYDQIESRFSHYRQRTSLRALRLFRVFKLDTLEIANRLHVKEPTVTRWLDNERNREYAEKHGS
jgi:hypothetical protein